MILKTRPTKVHDLSFPSLLRNVDLSIHITYSLILCAANCRYTISILCLYAIFHMCPINLFFSCAHHFLAQVILSFTLLLLLLLFLCVAAAVCVPVQGLAMLVLKDPWTCAQAHNCAKQSKLGQKPKWLYCHKIVAKILARMESFNHISHFSYLS